MVWENADRLKPKTSLSNSRQSRRRATALKCAIYQINPLERRTLLTGLATVGSLIPAPQGAYPQGSLVEDTNGDLFGTANWGGQYNLGTLFELTKGSNTINVLASFNGTNGSYPEDLASDSNGDLFGETMAGGAYNCGVIFEFAKGSNSISVIGTFNVANGVQPTGPLALDGNGNLFGATTYGGSYNVGTIFEVVAGTNSVTTLAIFNPNVNGGRPQGGVVLDANGNLFGTTTFGPVNPQNNNGNGTIFELAKGSNTISTYAYAAANAVDIEPTGQVIFDSSGNLYTVQNRYDAFNGDGTILGVAKGSNTINVLAAFNNANGYGPAANLILGNNGNIIGVAGSDGANGYGTVFEFSPANNSISTLVNFNNTIGESASSGLIEDANGDLFGSAAGGYFPDGPGAVFEIPQATGAVTPLAFFAGVGDFIGEAFAGLAKDPAGNFFIGSNSYYGTDGTTGALFELDAGSDTISFLAAFNGADGDYPDGITTDSEGNLFGTATNGGAYDKGTVFEVAAGTNSISVLASFNNSEYPDGQIIIDSQGDIYGTTQAGVAPNYDATIFEVIKGSNSVTTLATFGEQSSNNDPISMVMDGSGNLFGTIYEAASTFTSTGALFELPEGSHTIIEIGHLFGGTDGSNPTEITLGADGNIYGTTANGGQFGNGAVFEVSPTNLTHIVTLAALNGPNQESLVVNAQGNLFGTTYNTTSSNPFIGTFFEIASGSDSITTLDSSLPQPEGLILDSQGNIYGVDSGGIADGGRIFQFAATTVAGRYVFYADSSFDSNDATANINDLNAIAPDKTALLPGQTATYSNMTDYSKGINGVIIDISNLPSGATLTPADFQFATGDVNDTTTWTPLATSPTVTLLPASGGITPVDLTWPNGTITNTWLQVTVLADANTGLASNDVSYYGNLIGKVSDTGSPEQVTALDLTQIENNIVGVATITNPYDVNKDGSVDAEDLVYTQRNSFSAIRLITPTGDGPAAVIAATPQIVAAMSSGNSNSNLLVPLTVDSSTSNVTDLLGRPRRKTLHAHLQ